MFYLESKNQHTYLVPHFRRGIEGIELHPATNQHESAEFRRGIIERTRLNMGLNGLKPNGELPTLVNSKRLGKYDTRIKNALEPYGLTLTRLINNEILEKNEPIWIHQCDVNPHDFFLILSSRDTSEKEELGGDDPRFFCEMEALHLCWRNFGT